MNWQPIESIPKDGRMVLLWIEITRYGEDDDGNLIEAVEHDADFGNWVENEHGGYVDNYMGKIGDRDYATHWCEIEPPK